MQNKNNEIFVLATEVLLEGVTDSMAIEITKRQDPRELAVWRQETGDRLFPRFNAYCEDLTGVVGLNHGLIVHSLQDAIANNPLGEDDYIFNDAVTEFNAHST